MADANLTAGFAVSIGMLLAEQAAHLLLKRHGLRAVWPIRLNAAFVAIFATLLALSVAYPQPTYAWFQVAQNAASCAFCLATLAAGSPMIEDCESRARRLCPPLPPPHGCLPSRRSCLPHGAGRELPGDPPPRTPPAPSPQHAEARRGRAPAGVLARLCAPHPSPLLCRCSRQGREPRAAVGPLVVQGHLLAAHLGLGPGVCVHGGLLGGGHGGEGARRQHRLQLRAADSGHPDRWGAAPARAYGPGLVPAPVHPWPAGWSGARACCPCLLAAAGPLPAAACWCSWPDEQSTS
jgi:hypothetical protein